MEVLRRVTSDVFQYHSEDRPKGGSLEAGMEATANLQRKGDGSLSAGDIWVVKNWSNFEFGCILREELTRFAEEL